MKRTFLLLLYLVIGIVPVFGQDTIQTRLKIDLPFLDISQNFELPHRYPSMEQSLLWSKSLYDVAFWGIDGLGDKLFLKEGAQTSKTKLFLNEAFKYAVGLGFSKYGSELPIPLGVWAHEEFHRSTLGVAEVASKNGNWIFHRWDGTVYGITDESLDNLKENDLDQLLYSYVSGIQYEILLNQRISIEDFYMQRSHYKNALLLYNAYYVFDYFRFATSPLSDSVKVIAPQYEDVDPIGRDYAGADLTAWVYDMYNPDNAFTTRDPFPGGEGVNRRVGYSDLSVDAQNFLNVQKKLALLNFLNPSIFFINRINLSNDFSFNFFTQYVPTHFGNDIALYLPVSYKGSDFLVDFHLYNNNGSSGFGLGTGLFNIELGPAIGMDFNAMVWNQPTSFWNNSKILGGALKTGIDYKLNSNFSIYSDLTAKTKGWLIGNPYLKSDFSLLFGVKYILY